MNTDPTSVVRAWTDALNRHDAEAALAYIGDDSVFTNTGTGQRFIGVAENRAHYVDLFAVWPDVHFETIKLFGSGEYFVKEWIMTGVHSGEPVDHGALRAVGHFRRQRPGREIGGEACQRLQRGHADAPSVSTCFKSPRTKPGPLLRAKSSMPAESAASPWSRAQKTGPPSQRGKP